LEASNVVAKQDARPLLATFSYDENNRIKGATYPDYVATFQYDPVGNRTLAQNPAGSYVTTFTARNQVQWVIDPNSQMVSYTYDANGQRQTMTDPSGGVFTNTRDAAGRLKFLENPHGEQTSYTYDVNERLTNTGLANGGQANQRGRDSFLELTRAPFLPVPCWLANSSSPKLL
jgi:YD repeat-containing protein